MRSKAATSKASSAFSKQGKSAKGKEKEQAPEQLKVLQRAAESSHEDDNEELDDQEENEEATDEDEQEFEDVEEDDAVPVDQLSDAISVDEDAVAQQKVEIDNAIAMERIRETIRLDPSLPWTETLVVSYPETVDVDVDDDLNRELAFYKQALHCAKEAKTLAAKHNFPFTRPADYFAEMVKSDAHMERIRQRLLDESATIKRSDEKRKEREGKKFGKQVQMEKLRERERGKKEMEERLKGLKRKRKDALDDAQGNGEDFDVAVENAISDRPSKRGKTDGRGGKHTSRQQRDKKFGFGGPRKYSKQNDKSSTDNFQPRGGKPTRGGRGGARGGAKRPGKSRRVAARSRS
ncbi:hypothetical protein CERSUDRAFT_151210 [Gelatoporia subvermispora B]|uniref:Eukaryotic rRNA processing n=1 Tax=Ceriporiopsis subvermispora (strain B) TaxID=914234 RepID=M2RP16_CERS8|nr:hypothetical protein CERSUDRAFT_151210 [Gelatoporia subvermispora B]